MLIFKKMIKFKLVLLIFYIIRVGCLKANDSLSDLISDVYCHTGCSEIHLFSTSREHILPTCEQGCKFFNKIKQDNLLVSVAKNQCYSSCFGAYTTKNYRVLYDACISGCDCMANKYFIRGKDENGVDHKPLSKYELAKNLIRRNEISEDDDNSYRITETHIKTIPIGHFNNDDVLPGISSNDSLEKWLINTIHNPVIQKFACFLVTEIVIVLLLFRICVPLKQEPLYIDDTQPILFKITTTKSPDVKIKLFV